MSNSVSDGVTNTVNNLLLWILEGHSTNNSGNELGLISTAFLSLVYVPPREETAGHVSSKACPWRKFIIKFWQHFWWSEMSSDDNHRQAHMTPMTCNICTRSVFTTSSLNCGLQTYFGSHFCYRRALYAVFYKRVFFKKKVEQSCLKWCGKWHVKGHTYIGVYRVDTMYMYLFC